MATELSIERLYRLNDLLTAFAADEGIVFDSEEQEDERLNNATHAAAQALLGR